MSVSIPLYDALVSANVAPDKAKAVVEAFDKERATMNSELVTKEDLRVFLQLLETRLDAKIQLLESRMTIKLGAMLFGAVGVAVALFKVL
jgi:2-phosphoglycerate kinase